MTTYILQPCPTFGYGEHPFTTWENAFSAEEIAKIIDIGDSLVQEKGCLGGGVTNPEYRESNVGWIQLNDETRWIFDRLGHVAQNLNGKFYGYDLFGFCEGLQYTTYNAETKGHYDWHQDWGVATGSPRKLSLVVQLTSPEDYEGGDLEVMSSKAPAVVLKQQGLAAAFPSFMLHRVTPVTKGIRRTLVAWIAGPKFK